jgi:hypothetical protein
MIVARVSEVGSYDPSAVAWADAAAGCSPPSSYDRHPDEDWLRVAICRLSEFALFGELAAADQNYVYLPAILK